MRTLQLKWSRIYLPVFQNHKRIFNYMSYTPKGQFTITPSGSKQEPAYTVWFAKPDRLRNAVRYSQSLAGAKQQAQDYYDEYYG